jgi:hypothetical protein
MRVPLTHGAATAWLIALVAMLIPATALAAPAADPLPPPDNGAQQQPAGPPPDPCAAPASPGCPPADTPPADTPPADPVIQTPADPGPAPLGPSGPVVVAPVQPGAADTAPADLSTTPVQSLAPSLPVRHDDPPHADAPHADAPSKPYGHDDKPKHDQPKKPDGSGTPSPSGNTSGGDDHRGDEGNGNGNANGNGDDHERDPFVFDRETLRLGGCRTFSTATAKVTFERVRFGKDRFTVTVRDLDVPEGTVLTVRIDGRIAGTLTIDDRGRGKLTRRGDHLPRFLRLGGDERVTISNDAGDVLLSRACVQKAGDDGGD